MYVPIKWLKDYIDLDEDIKTLADKLSDSGSHVESIITRSEGIEGVYTGKILKIKIYKLLRERKMFLKEQLSL